MTTLQYSLTNGINTVK